MHSTGGDVADRKRQKETKMNISEWLEYAAQCAYEAREAYYAAQNICPSCGGMGDHGVEEDTGCLFTCYSCGGTGRYHGEVAA
jgi:DnaJ-class molecular chaperone